MSKAEKSQATPEQIAHMNRVHSEINNKIRDLQMQYDTKHLAIGLLLNASAMFRALHSAKVMSSDELTLTVNEAFKNVLDPLETAVKTMVLDANEQGDVKIPTKRVQ